jgi:hypothetical protein
MPMKKTPYQFPIDLRGMGTNTNLKTKIFELIAKADDENLARLRKGFPDEVAFYLTWVGSPEDKIPEEFFVPE